MARIARLARSGQSDWSFGGKMNRFLNVILGAGLAALAFAAPAAADEGNCNASASTAWTQAGTGYGIEAFSHGKTCRDAVIGLYVTAPDGVVVFVEAFPAMQMMLTVSVQNADEMSKALAEWITQEGATLKMTSDLPEWAPGQELPMLGDFAFMPAEAYDAESYNVVRAENRPLLCYVQGMESMMCQVLATEGYVYPIGVQTFPG